MRLNLKKAMFTESEYELVSHGEIRVFAFKYSTGVEALKVENAKGYFIILPFQGQQIWKMNFHGKDLSMKTTIKEPVPTTEYLKTYGGFLYHCGISSSGVPQADDTHPKHGETPNIEYTNASIICGENSEGKFVSIEGTLDYDIAFVMKYKFTPKCTLFEDDSIVRIDVELENMRHSPMEYMYLCHINFAPIDGSKLIYSVPRDKEHIKIFDKIPEGISEEQKEKLSGYINRLKKDITLHDSVGNNEEVYNPELCFGLRYNADENGRAYTLQYKEGEGACYVSHPVKELPVGIRWIARTGDEDSMGMVLPSTSEHLGYMNAKRLGQIKTLDGGEKIAFYIETGYLDDQRALETIKKVKKMY